MPEKINEISQPERVSLFYQMLDSGSRDFNLESLSAKSLRDLNLSIRSRQVPEELSLLNDLGLNNNIIFLREYGTYLIPPFKSAYAHKDIVDYLTCSGNTYVVSTPTWKSAKEDLLSRDFGAGIVLLPEIITLAGETSHRQLGNRKLIKEKMQENLEEMRDISTLQDRATFIFGSLDFLDGPEPPYNAAHIMLNGQIWETYHKRALTEAELKYFSGELNSESLYWGRSGILICRDLFELALRNRRFEEDEETFLVLSCWGTGGTKWIMEQRNVQTQSEINDYYEKSLQTCCERVLTHNQITERIILADRTVSLSTPSPDNLVADRPMSVVAFSR